MLCVIWLTSNGDKYSLVMTICTDGDDKPSILQVTLVITSFRMCQYFWLDEWYEFKVKFNLSWTSFSSLMISYTYFFKYDLTECNT